MRRRSTVGGALEMFSLPLPLPLQHLVFEVWLRDGPQTDDGRQLRYIWSLRRGGTVSLRSATNGVAYTIVLSRTVHWKCVNSLKNVHNIRLDLTKVCQICKHIENFQQMFGDQWFHVSRVVDHSTKTWFTGSGTEITRWHSITLTLKWCHRRRRWVRQVEYSWPI